MSPACRWAWIRRRRLDLLFGRTAARLYVSQARVSQAIGQQERRIGAPLFDRSNRRQVRLTPIGRQLRDDLLPVHAGLRESLERARMAALGITARLRVGLLPFNVHDLHPYWRAFRDRHPQWDLQLRRAPFVEPFARLRAGDMDVLIAWLPVEEPDLTVGPVLFTDPRILAVSAEHELAGRSSAPLEALGDFAHALRRADQPGRHRRDRPQLPRPRHPVLGDAPPPLAAHARHAPPGLRPVWQAEAETDLTRAFAQTIRDLGPTTG